MAVRKLAAGKRRWQADWTDANQRRQRKNFATKREAEDFLYQTMQAVRSGTYVDPRTATRTTVHDLYEEWIARIQSKGARGRGPASPKTVDNYRRFYENYVRPRWEHTSLSNVRYEATAEWITALQGRNGRPAGAATRREVGLLFGRLIDFAVKQRILGTNPVRDPLGRTDYIPAAQKQREHVYLTMGQLVNLADASGDYDLMVMIAGTCGLRWGEVTALTTMDVHFGPRPTIVVNKAFSEVNGKLSLKDTKGGENRVVPLPRVLADRLQVVVANLPRDSRLFNGSRGSALRNSTWTRRHYRPAIEAAVLLEPDFPRPTFHDLRHTAVSLAISSGVNVKVVQRIAGHASATMTLDTYAGLFDDDLHDSAERLNAALGNLGWK